MKRKLMLMLAILLFLLPNAASAAHSVAYMDSRFTCGCSRGGTGAMIGRYGLITAAHNLYCPEHGKPLKNCGFYFGANSPNSCWYKYDGKFLYRVYETFQNGYNSRNDIGYVVFDTPVGDETGWFGYIVGDDHYLHEEFTHVANYDRKRHLQSLFEVQYVLDSTRIYWTGWINGTDGGPVYFNNEDLNFESYVVAVYTSHDDEGNGYGRRLTNNVIQDMRADGAFN